MAMETVKYLVAEASASSVAATIWSSVATLDGLIDSNHGYVSGCQSLRESLLRLHDVVRKLKEEEEKKNADVLISARISASKTFALVDKIAARTKAGIRCFKWCCLKRDHVPAGLEKQRNESESLVNELSSLLLKDGAEAKQISDEVREPGGGKQGVNTLELKTGHRLDCAIKRGKTLSFNVTDSEEQVAYTVKTWLNNPKSWLRIAKRMSGSVESNPTGAQGMEEQQQQVAYDVRLPEEKPGGCHPAERTAFISTSSDGAVQALVKSVLPRNTPFCCGRRIKGAGTLLQRGHMVIRGRGEGVQYEYERQSYAVEVQMNGLGVQGLTKDEVRVLRVEGKKMGRKVEYACFVKQTGEVLAIYHHKRRPCITACCGPPASGVVRFLGVGNQPQLRDLLFCTFVAMGLTSDL